VSAPSRVQKPTVLLAAFYGECLGEANPAILIAHRVEQTARSLDLSFQISAIAELPSGTEYVKPDEMGLLHPPQYADIDCCLKNSILGGLSANFRPDIVLGLGVSKQARERHLLIEACSVGYRQASQGGPLIPLNPLLADEYAPSTLPNAQIIEACHARGTPMAEHDIRTHNHITACNAVMASALKITRHMSTVAGFLHVLLSPTQADRAAQYPEGGPEEYGGVWANMDLDLQAQGVITALCVTTEYVQAGLHLAHPAYSKLLPA
jgi:hypothetical protein